MARGGHKHRRKQRQKRWLDEQIANYEERPDHPDGPSGGQFYVLNYETGEKTPGLNLKQAQELWRSLPKAAFFEMDHYKPGKAPLEARFDAGKLP